MRTKTVVEVGRAEKGSEKRQTCIVSFRVAASQVKAMKDAAEADGCSFGEWARERLAEVLLDGPRQLEREDDADDQVDESNEEAAQEAMETFLESVASSARGLARGWLSAKLLPKLEARHKRCQVCGKLRKKLEQGLCSSCNEGVDKVEF